MKENMERRITAYIEKHKMLKRGDRVIVGISGGADSVCLLLILLALRERYDLKLHLVHINHGLRGSAADADQTFVEKLGKHHGIAVTSFLVDVKGRAKEQGLTEEEAGRRLRYESFYQIWRTEGGDKIAVAHNKNDNAETMLFHLARGTGLKGLCGIPPVRGEIIRPLLCVEREEIEEYLNGCGQSFCKDATNEENAYARNRIRHEVLPVIKEQINSGVIENMARCAQLLRQSQEYVESCAKLAFERIVKMRNGQYLMEIEALKQEDIILQKEIFRRCVQSLAGGLKDMDHRHMEQLLGLLDMESGKKISLPDKVEAWREYGVICIGIHEEETAEFEIIIDGEGEYPISQTKGLLLISIEDFGKNMNEIPENDYTKWFDYDKICQTVSLRNRRNGDYFQVNAAGGTKKLKDYFIDKKIPRSERSKYPLLTDGHHVIWILGDRISEKYKVTEYTKTILKVKIIGGKGNEH